VDGLAAAVLMLADSRLPAGGHAHSGGVEAALGTGLLTGQDGLAVFLAERLRTAGLAAAGLAAAACRQALAGGPGWAALDAEADARTPSPAQRHTSRQQGRALVRLARTAWPGPVWTDLPPAGPHHPIALGIAVAAAATPPAATPPGATPPGATPPGATPPGAGPPGDDPAGAVCQAALVAAYLAVSGPAAAAVRLRGFDPLAVQAALAGLGAEIAAVARTAAAAAAGPLADLPCPAAPRLDILAELHARAEVRLFAS
jgi:urease accessory protein